MVNRLHNVSGVRWPKKSENPDPKRDTSKYCNFHDDIGHTTEECNNLKREVAYLLKRDLLDVIKWLKRDVSTL